MRRSSRSISSSGAGMARFGRLALLGACVALSGGCRADARPAAGSAATATVAPIASPSARRPATTAIRTDIGFRSPRYLDEHFAKHGSEFRGMSKEDYLLAAQTLRDSPVGGDIEEIMRGDGTTSRFDKVSGAFIAFNRDGMIRTFFKPNDGERYFRRQAERSQ